MLLWAGGLILWNSLRERHAIERGLSETVSALVIAVDQDLQLTIEALATVALSHPFDDSTPAHFNVLLRDLAARHRSWLYVSLLDAEGRQLINTAAPAGAVLPGILAYGDNELATTFRRILAQGRPDVSNLFTGLVSHRPHVVVGVPVLGPDGRVAYVLMAGLLPQSLSELLRSQQGPPGWLAAIVDGNHKVVARSIEQDRFIGLPTLDWYTQAVAGRNQGIVSGPTLHGPKFTIAFHRSSRSDWVISFGAPQDVFTGTLNKSLAVTVGFGLALMTGSILLALAVARRILGPVQALTAAARPFLAPRANGGGTPRADGGGTPRADGGTTQYDIAELDSLHCALDGLADDLARSRARFRKVFSVAPVMLFVCDAKFHLTEVNEFWLKTLGYSSDEVLGRSPLDFHTPASRAQGVAAILPLFLERGALDDVPAQYVTKAGEVRDVLVSLRGETNVQGDILRSIGAIRDVTESRLAQKALNRAVEEAASANAAKTRFLAAASHDLRQPLQGLSLYLGVLKGGDETVMTAIGQCVDSLTGLLDDMLDVSRLDAGIITPKVTEVPVARLLERVAAAWTIQAEVKGLRLQVAHCRGIVRTDPALMDRLLSNLVANAVRYTVSGRILVGCRRAANGHIRLEVWDTGIGIPADKLGDIFEEFRQLGNPERRRDRGTGLGLAIVQRIVGLLGHQMSVRSRPGRGSVFAVTLPAVVACGLPEAVETESVADMRRRILVVDDEAHVRAALAMVLRDLGHVVATAEGVEDALERLDEIQPQLVIADFRLGGDHTGIEVVRAVRQSMGDQVQAVVLTGDTDPATIRRIVGAGLHLLHKPLQVEALKTFLRQVA